MPYVLPVQKELEQVDFQIHHWKINDWTSLETRSHGPIFEAAGFQWYIIYYLVVLLHKLILYRRILLFPKGNGQHEMISVYLEVVMDTKKEGYNKTWSVCGQFAVVISNPDHPKQFFTNRNEFSIRVLRFFN